MKAFAILLLAVLPGTRLLDAQTVTATPAALTFTWQIGAALPAAQSVALKITAGTPAFTVLAPPDPWLIVTPASGKFPGSISVQVNPSTLMPGPYTSAIIVAVAGVSTPVTVNVSLTVSQSAAAPVIAPTTLAVTFPGTVTSSFVVTAGQAPLTFTATTSPAWLTVAPTAGAILPSAAATLTVTANPATLVAQTAAYAGKVTVVTTSNGVSKTQVVTVNLTVNSTPPAITSIWPWLIAAGSGNTTVTIRGTGFFTGSTVTTGGSPTPLKITVLSSTAILATLPSTLLTVAATINLIVKNPSPGGSSAPFPISVGNSPFITGITNAASYAQGGISPGEMITIFGQNLGPTPPVQLTLVDGIAEGGVGGVTVTIDTQEAPIIYASDSQVSVQVPYAAQLGTFAAGTQRNLVLSYGSGPSAQTFTEIVPAAPGVFTTNASGSGQALVLNFDPLTLSSTINSTATPAKIGSTITIFLTGEGDYAAASYPAETGLMVPSTPPASTNSYPQLSPLPTVTIGGTPGVVSYAGPIPTCLLGLLQINVVIPAGSATGTAVPLAVTIGAAQAQSNLTLAVSP